MVAAMVYFGSGKTSRAVKIGYTEGEPERRLRALQTGSPERLELVAVVDADREFEQGLHHHLRAHRNHGEWFAPVPEVLEIVDRAAKIYRLTAGLRELATPPASESIGV